jgi:electron transfer flavoprotein alpha subunit
VANIVVIVEQHEGRPLPSSLETLGLGRRVASRLGATLHAAVTLPAPPHYGDNDLIANLAACGADKVVLLIDKRIGDRFGTDFRWDTHGPALSKMAELTAPALILFAETSFGRELGPRLAARIGAGLLTPGWVEVDEARRLWLWEGAGESARKLELFEGELDFPVVVTVPRGRYEMASGDEEAEVEIVKIEDHALDFEELEVKVDPTAAPTVFYADEQPPTGPVTAAASALAEALGGESRSSTDLPPSRLQIRLGSRSPAAEVLVSMGLGADTAREADFALDGPIPVIVQALLARLKESS